MGHLVSRRFITPQGHSGHNDLNAYRDHCVITVLQQSQEPSCKISLNRICLSHYLKMVTPLHITLQVRLVFVALSAINQTCITNWQEYIRICGKNFIPKRIRIFMIRGGAAVSRQYSVWLRAGRSGFNPLQGQRNVLLAPASKPALESTHPILWVPEVKRYQNVTLTTHLHLVPRSKITPMLSMSRSYTSSPPMWYYVAGQSSFFFLTYDAWSSLLKLWREGKVTNALVI
jgi:hypothetical protein